MASLIHSEVGTQNVAWTLEGPLTLLGGVAARKAHKESVGHSELLKEWNSGPGT